MPRRWAPFIAAVLTGVAAGVGGMLLTLLLHLIQHLAFGYSDATFLAGVQQASAGRRVLAVTVGGLVVGLGWWALRRSYPKITTPEQLLRHPNRSSPFGAVVADATLQIAAVGFGASLGREGAPRQLGAALAGWIAGMTRLDPRQRRLMIACGAGAGLAAVYNVPLGGAVFTLEVLLGSMARADAVPALISSVVATVTAWPVVTRFPTYVVAPQPFSWAVLVWAVLLGPLAGAAALAFNRLTHWARTLAPTGWRLPVATTAVFAGLGVLAIWCPELLGNGKGPAQLALAGLGGIGSFALLAVLKPVTSAACLASGASGGLLTPSLATGAMLGAAAGELWSLLWPGTSVVAYAIVGAAAFLATTQRAPLTAIVLVAEFTHTGVDLAAPVIIAVGLAMTTAGWLGRSGVRQPDLPSKTPAPDSS